VNTRGVCVLNMEAAFRTKRSSQCNKPLNYDNQRLGNLTSRTFVLISVVSSVSSTFVSDKKSIANVCYFSQGFTIARKLKHAGYSKHHLL
jgi:hypothetical protein